MVVRLTAKLAEVVNGVDLSRYQEGDIVELPARDAEMLLAEGWADLVVDSDITTSPRRPSGRAVAADRKRSGTNE